MWTLFSRKGRSDKKRPATWTVKSSEGPNRPLSKEDVEASKELTRKVIARSDTPSPQGRKAGAVRRPPL